APVAPLAFLGLRARRLLFLGALAAWRGVAAAWTTPVVAAGRGPSAEAAGGARGTEVARGAAGAARAWAAEAARARAAEAAAAARARGGGGGARGSHPQEDRQDRRQALGRRSRPPAAGPRAWPAPPRR